MRRKIIGEPVGSSFSVHLGTKKQALAFAVSDQSHQCFVFRILHAVIVVIILSKRQALPLTQRLIGPQTRIATTNPWTTAESITNSLVLQTVDTLWWNEQSNMLLLLASTAVCLNQWSLIL